MFFNFLGQALDVVAAPERVHGLRHARFVSDDLLRTQRDARGLFRGQRQCLIESIGVQ